MLLSAEDPDDLDVDGAGEWADAVLDRLPPGTPPSWPPLTTVRDLDLVAADPGAVQGALAGLVQNRLNDLIGRSSGYIEALPVEVKRSVAGLQGIQVQQMDLQNQFKREVWELEKKVRIFF